MTTEVVAYNIKRLRHREVQIQFSLTDDSGVEHEFTMNPDLAYNFGSKMRKRIETANQVPEGGNGEKYSNFYGMQY